MKNYDVIIIGGGASGCMAAIWACINSGLNKNNIRNTKTYKSKNCHENITSC